MENALDAGASRITVEVKAGGRSLIRVTDDGHGMSRDDALMASNAMPPVKLPARISPLSAQWAFAAPSIASVSRFTLTAKLKPKLARRSSSTAAMISVKEAGAAVGTKWRSARFLQPPRSP